MHPSASKTVVACAFGLLGAFFLPWVQLGGSGMSGYNLGRIGSYGNYAWVIPILAGSTIWLSVSGVNNRGMGAITGVVPLGAVLYVIIRLGAEARGRIALGIGDAIQGVLEVAGHVLSIGAWLTIMFSVAIVVAALRTPQRSSGLRKRRNRLPPSITPGATKDAEQIWRRKSDEEVREAERQLNDYTESGKRVILTELRRRGLHVHTEEQDVGGDTAADGSPAAESDVEPVDFCYHCGAEVVSHVSKCPNCGKEI